MSRLPERLPGLEGFYRGFHNSTALPAPAISHAQWDFGDCTGRAVSAWIFLREMLGDSSTGAEVERGQKAFLLSLLSPVTGLVSVPDLSNPSERSYYHHLWDQGRTLRGLVHWYRGSGSEPAVQAELKVRVTTMIEGLRRLPVYGTDPDWGAYVVFTSDIYRNEKPEPSDGFAWVWGGQLIEPLVEWAEASGDEGTLELALRIASGTLSGRQSEGRTGSTKRALEFGPDGSFTSHFHNRASVMLGVVKLGEALVKAGQREKGLELIKRAKRTYDWIFDQASNVNAAGSFGWFPEGMADGVQARVISETCCTADMIELAAELARSSRLDASLAGLARLYDDAERFTLNGLMKAQFSATPEYEGLLARTRMPVGSEIERIIRGQTALKSAARLEGTSADVFYPNDKVQVIKQTGTPYLTVGGCCHYSGVRGLYGCWKNIITVEGKDLLVHMSMSRDCDRARIRSHLPERGLLELAMREAGNVLYRVPDWADWRSVRVTGAGKPVPLVQDDRLPGYLRVDGLRAGDLLSISLPVTQRITKEKIGGNNLGGGGGEGSCDPSEKIVYTIRWAGNSVESIEPQGRYLPLFP